MKIFLNEITQFLYIKFSEKINLFVGNDKWMIEKSNGEFSEFLLSIHNNETNIKNYLLGCKCPTPPTKRFTHSKTVKNYKFTFEIYPDASSSFDISFIKNIKIDFEKTFLYSKMYEESGYVYILKSEYGYKIGHTGNLHQRMRTLKLVVPFNVELDSVIKCDNHAYIEKFLHQTLKHKRIKGEWFSLSDSEFNEIDKILSNLNLKRDIRKNDGINKFVLQ